MKRWLFGLTGVIAMLTCIICHTANAQSIESLVMPGDLIQGHADLESECSSCHKAFSRSDQKELCLDCHEDVDDDINSDTGFHGKFSDARSNECASCHTDHEGRGADILGLDESTFDHLFTNFELRGKHVETQCADCHEPADKHRDAPGDCIGCHRDDNIHNESIGTECADCHNETDWLEISFDHDSTDYPLIGNHLEVACTDCHEDKSLQVTQTTCFGCHADDDFHEGRSGEQCENCHSPVSWTETTFDHARDTEFRLKGQHALLTCDDCHSDDPFSDRLETECVGCHLEDDEHDGHHGTDCGSCHSNDEWAVTLFNHDDDTDFILRGSHPTVACIDCHVEPIFDASPGTTCASCHLEDEVHDGKQGDQCNNCHTEESWQEAPLFVHGLTRFPLLGEHDNLECDSCHETTIFAGTNSDCIDCHAEDDTHEGRFNDNCGSCHNPVAWDLWLFDHNVQTSFSLSGAHVNVACNDCHRGTLASMQRVGNTCSDCHRSDDVHDSEFGSDCGRCHSDTSFSDVRSLQ